MKWGECPQKVLGEKGKSSQKDTKKVLGTASVANIARCWAYFENLTMKDKVLTVPQFDAIKVYFRDAATKTITLEEFCSLSWDVASEAIATYEGTKDPEDPKKREADKLKLAAVWFNKTCT